MTIEGWRGAAPPIPNLVARLSHLPGPVQLLRADRIMGRDHLRSAVEKADRAFEQGRNVATTWPLEVLRYAAGERQIGRALAFLGLAAGPAAVAVVLRGDPAEWHSLARALGWERDDAVLDGSDAVLDAWGIAPAARAMLPPDRRADLVLERVALSDVAR